MNLQNKFRSPSRQQTHKVTQIFTKGWSGVGGGGTSRVVGGKGVCVVTSIVHLTTMCFLKLLQGLKINYIDKLIWYCQSSTKIIKPSRLKT